MTRLNHFILWRKGWYVCINDKDMFDQAVDMLTLDGYICCQRRNVIGIVLRYIDTLKEKGSIHPQTHYLLHSTWHSSITHNIQTYNVDYEKAVLITIKHFFAFHIERNDFPLEPPTYSRKLYKMGFVCPRHFGNSYKMCNHKVKKFFKKDRVLE